MGKYLYFAVVLFVYWYLDQVYVAPASCLLPRPHISEQSLIVLLGAWYLYRQIFVAPIPVSPAHAGRRTQRGNEEERRRKGGGDTVENGIMTSGFRAARTKRSDSCCG
eukprot:758473-Hanusia_phi.AAC.4